MDTDFFLAWFAGMAELIRLRRDHLTELDAAIGDADHGTNLDRFPAAADPRATTAATTRLTGRTIWGWCGRTCR